MTASRQFRLRIRNGAPIKAHAVSAWKRMYIGLGEIRGRRWRFSKGGKAMFEFCKRNWLALSFFFAGICPMGIAVIAQSVPMNFGDFHLSGTQVGDVSPTVPPENSIRPWQPQKPVSYRIKWLPHSVVRCPGTGTNGERATSHQRPSTINVVV